MDPPPSLCLLTDGLALGQEKLCSSGQGAPDTPLLAQNHVLVNFNLHTVERHTVQAAGDRAALGSSRSRPETGSPPRGGAMSPRCPQNSWGGQRLSPRLPLPEPADAPNIHPSIAPRASWCCWVRQPPPSTPSQVGVRSCWLPCLLSQCLFPLW